MYKLISKYNVVYVKDIIDTELSGKLILWTNNIHHAKSFMFQDDLESYLIDNNIFEDVLILDI